MEKVGLEGCPDYSIHELKEKRSKYCLCIFALNEKGRIDSELGKIRHISQKWDVILADGNSTDGTNDLDFLRENHLRALLIKKGAGKLGAQMRMAFHYAMEQGYEGVVVVDGNDKDDVARSFDDFITKLDQGYDHVQGSRYIVGGIHENTPKSRHFAVRFIHAPLITMSSGFMCTDTTNGFRAYSRKLLTDPGIAVMRDVLSGYELHYYVAIEASNQGFKMAEIPVTRSYPDSGNIPSKIVGMSGNFKVLKTLFSTAFGEFRVGSDTSVWGRVKSFFSFLIADRLPVSLDIRIISGIISLLFTALILSAGINIADAPITDFSQRTIGQVVFDGINADHRNKVFVLGFVLGVNIFLLINRIILFLTLFYQKTFGDNIIKALGSLAAVTIVPVALAKFNGGFAPIRDFFLYSFLWLFSFTTITAIRGYFDPHINSFSKKIWKEAIMLGLVPVTAWVFKDLMLHGIVSLSSKEFFIAYFSSLIISLLLIIGLKKHFKAIFQFGRIQIYFLLVSIISLFIGQEIQFFLSQKGISLSYYLTYVSSVVTGLIIGFLARKKLLSPKFDFTKFIVFPFIVICFFLLKISKLVP